MVFKERRLNPQLAKEIFHRPWSSLSMLVLIRKLLGKFVNLSDGANLRVVGSN